MSAYCHTAFGADFTLRVAEKRNPNRKANYPYWFTKEMHPFHLYGLQTE